MVSSEDRRSSTPVLPSPSRSDPRPLGEWRCCLICKLVSQNKITDIYFLGPAVES